MSTNRTPPTPTSRRRGGHRTARLLPAAALAALTAGCAVANAAAPSAPSPTAPGASTHSTMAMPTPPSAPGSGAAQDGAPSAAALMICGPEIVNDVTAMLALPTPPHTSATWSNRLYTCTYHLPSGSFVLSVQDSPDATAGNAYFQALRQRWPTAHPLTGALGLGDPGYETPEGSIVILKDGKTLQVDATALPAASGPNQLSRTDTAYEIATDVIGCWNGK